METTYLSSEPKPFHPQAKPVTDDLAAVDLAHLDQALDACDFLATGTCSACSLLVRIKEATI